MEVVEPDPRADLLTYLGGQSCGACRSSLGSVALVDLSPFYGVVFRCFPPPPSCWEFLCPGCRQQIIVCVRKGKAWPLGISMAS